VAGARWLFVGGLPPNSARLRAPGRAGRQAGAGAALGPATARRAPGARVLVEVNVGEEQQKGGCAPAEVAALVDRLRAEGLDVAGLMAVPPHDDDPGRWFARLREQAVGLGLTELSMGMTDDFEVAVEEGATIVRVGRALFGPRR
jgi:uncharacterized pyridoxal phosphate-containing UPF0001 family protein